MRTAEEAREQLVVAKEQRQRAVQENMYHLLKLIDEALEKRISLGFNTLRFPLPSGFGTDIDSALLTSLRDKYHYECYIIDRVLTLTIPEANPPTRADNDDDEF